MKTSVAAVAIMAICMSATSSLFGSAVPDGEIPVSELTPKLISEFPANRMHKISPSAIAALAPNLVEALTADQLAQVTPDQIAALSPAQVAVLIPSQVASLRSHAAAAFSPAQVQALGTGTIRGLKRHAIAALTPDAIAALSIQQIEALRPDQVGALKASQAARLTAAQTAGLSPNQVAQLKPDAAKALTPNAIAALGPYSAVAFKANISGTGHPASQNNPTMVPPFASPNGASPLWSARPYTPQTIPRGQPQQAMGPTGPGAQGFLRPFYGQQPYWQQTGSPMVQNPPAPLSNNKKKKLKRLDHQARMLAMRLEAIEKKTEKIYPGYLQLHPFPGHENYQHGQMSPQLGQMFPQQRQMSPQQVRMYR